MAVNCALTFRFFKTEETFDAGPVSEVHAMYCIIAGRATLCWQLTVLRNGGFIFERDP